MTHSKHSRKWCGRCGGTGRFVTGGKCYRCRGKGWQSSADERRNEYYDMRRVEAEARAMMGGGA